jgi:hypothetical protein
LAGTASVGGWIRTDCREHLVAIVIAIASTLGPNAYNSGFAGMGRGEEVDHVLLSLWPNKNLGSSPGADPETIRQFSGTRNNLGDTGSGQNIFLLSIGQQSISFQQIFTRHRSVVALTCSKIPGKRRCTPSDCQYHADSKYLFHRTHSQS